MRNAKALAAHYVGALWRVNRRAGSVLHTLITVRKAHRSFIGGTMTDTEHRTGIDRRTVMAGAAWTVPAVMVASALPAYASSRTKTQVGISIVAAATGQQEPIITLSLATDDGTRLNSPTSANFTITVTNGDTKSYNIDPVVVTTTPASGVSIVDPASQTVAAGGSVSFTTTLSVTAATLTATLASASLILNGWAKQKNLSVSVAYTGGTVAGNNGTLVAPSPNPVTFSDTP